MNTYYRSDSITETKILYRYKNDEYHEINQTSFNHTDRFTSEQDLINAIKFVLEYKEGKIGDTNKGNEGSFLNEEFVKWLNKIIDKTLKDGFSKPTQKISLDYSGNFDSGWIYYTNTSDG